MPDNDDPPPIEGAAPPDPKGPRPRGRRPVPPQPAAEARKDDDEDPQEDSDDDAAWADEQGGAKANRRAPSDHVGWPDDHELIPDAATQAHALLHGPVVREADRRRAGQMLLAAYHGPFRRATTWRGSLLTPEDAEELTSNAVLKFMTEVPRECTDPARWLWKVLLNGARTRVRALRAARRNNGVAPDSLDEATGEDGLPLHECLADDREKTDPVEVLMRRESRHMAVHIVRALHARSPKATAVLLLAAKGYSHAEIGAALGMSPSAVGSMLNYWRELLEQMFKDNDQ